MFIQVLMFSLKIGFLKAGWEERSIWFCLICVTWKWICIKLEMPFLYENENKNMEFCVVWLVHVLSVEKV